MRSSPQQAALTLPREGEGSLKRVLVLGGSGMLGHKLCQVLKDDCEVYTTFRRYNGRLRMTGLFDERRVIDGVDVWDMSSVQRALAVSRPEWVVNCIGVIKQLPEARSPKTSIYVNGLFPHLLCELCGNADARVIHLSTDCVFSGKKGNYTEDDPSDAADLYGRTKFLGEVDYAHALTLRTSIVGRSLFGTVSLIDWFLSQSGKRIKGYTNAIYTGLSTHVLSREVVRIMTKHSLLNGLYQLSSATITKYDLLTLVNRVFDAGVTIEPDCEVVYDRSLCSDRYQRETGFKPPTWDEMVVEMAQDPTPYDRIRTAVA